MYIFAERLNPLNNYLFMEHTGEGGDRKQLTAFPNAFLYRTDTGKTVLETIFEDSCLPCAVAACDFGGTKSTTQRKRYGARKLILHFD
jgi:hypothetical protein